MKIENTNSGVLLTGLYKTPDGTLKERLINRADEASLDYELNALLERAVKL
jgi:hypothetical protein